MDIYRWNRALILIIVLILSGVGCIDEDYLLVAQRQYAEKYGIKLEQLEPQLEDETNQGRAGSNHLPYQERQCTSCHLAAGSISTQAKGNELCAFCHEFKETVVQDCLDCHDPHKSTRDFLLRQGAEGLTCQYSGDQQ